MASSLHRFLVGVGRVILGEGVTRFFYSGRDKYYQDSVGGYIIVGGRVRRDYHHVYHSYAADRGLGVDNGAVQTMRRIIPSGRVNGKVCVYVDHWCDTID